MATGRLGTPALLSATTNTTIYTNATSYAVVSVTMCNQSSSAVQVRLALASSASPTTAEYIEYGATIPPNGVLERTGLVMQNGMNLVAYAGTGSAVSVVAYGIET